MYSSLDKLDLGVAFGDTAYFIQTDHRDAQTISDEAAMTVVFAIVRLLRAREAAEASGRSPYRIVYQLDGEPPAFLAYVAGACGASVVPRVTRETRLPELAVRPAEVLALFTDACARIADAAWQRADVSRTFAGLAAYEHRMARPDPDEDFYAEAIVAFGCVAASLLAGHAWQRGDGLLGFTIAGHDVFGAAQRYIEHGFSRSILPVLGERIAPGDPFAAFTAQTGIAIDPAVLEARAVGGVPDEPANRAVAEALVRECAAHLRSWGVAIGDAIAWVAQPAMHTDMRPVGKLVVDLVSTAHRGNDGLYALYRAVQPYGEATRRAAERNVFIDGTREDWLTDAEFRSAAALELRVPASAPRFAGQKIGELPNPFAPLLAIWATGYLVQSLDEHGATLVAITPPER